MPISRNGLILVAVLGSTVALPKAFAQYPTVTALSGTFQGDTIGSVNRFLGIPYAQPPVGSLRWQAPLPKTVAGTYPAHQFSQPCVQTGSIFGTTNVAQLGETMGAEDCLYLNIWAPARGANRPVIVFVHGGAGVYGTGALNIYGGANFASQADAVYVTINYRLGFFGGMYYPPLFDGNAFDDSGNYGLLDMVESLKWVQANISAFGGNPANVTISGQSAGCIAIHSLMESPAATGLFQKALCMSGVETHTDTGTATQAATNLVTNLLLADGRITSASQASATISGMQATGTLIPYLKSRPAYEVLTAQNTDVPGTSSAPSVSLSNEDGTVIPDQGAGSPTYVNQVPAILGTVKQEATILLFLGFSPLDQTSFWNLDQQDPPGLTDANLITPSQQLSYNLTTGITDSALWATVNSIADTMSSNGQTVYRYELSWDNYPAPWSGEFGAFHGLDVPLSFNSFPSGQPNLVNFVTPSSSRTTLSQHMLAALRGFLETGDPNTYLGQFGLPVWQSWAQNRTDYEWTH